MFDGVHFGTSRSCLFRSIYWSRETLFTLIWSNFDPTQIIRWETNIWECKQKYFWKIAKIQAGQTISHLQPIRHRLAPNWQAENASAVPKIAFLQVPTTKVGPPPGRASPENRLIQKRERSPFHIGIGLHMWRKKKVTHMLRRYLKAAALHLNQARKVSMNFTRYFVGWPL